MSAGFAVAAATAAFADRLHALIGDAVPGARVTTLNPGSQALRHGEPIANLYLFRTLRNGAMTNRDLPTRDPGGRAMSPPAIALDLDYMITLFGDEGRLDPQRLLGLIVGGLHAEPFLSREAVRATIAATPWLGGAGLDAQRDAIRITPIALAPDAMARLWSEFVNVPYQLTQLYTLTPVILAMAADIAPVLPVRRVGATASRSGPIRFGPIVDADDPDLPIRAGGRMAVRLADTARSGLAVQIDGREVRAEPGLEAQGRAALLVTLDQSQSVPLAVGPVSVRLVEPAPPGGTPTPSQAIRAIIVPGFARAPTYDPDRHAILLPLALPVGGDATVALVLYPFAGAAGPARRIAVPLGGGPARDLYAPVADLRPGTYLAGIEIDGLSSVLDYDGGRYSGPLVTIPEQGRPTQTRPETPR